MSDFLVDTSVWVAFFRGEAAAVARLDPLLAARRVAVAGPIYAEVLSGAPTRVVQDRLKTLFKSLSWLPEPEEVWDRVAETRFTLARQGYQAKLVEVMIALTAAQAGCTLLSQDRDFEKIQRVLPLDLVLF